MKIFSLQKIRTFEIKLKTVLIITFTPDNVFLPQGYPMLITYCASFRLCVCARACACAHAHIQTHIITGDLLKILFPASLTFPFFTKNMCSLGNLENICFKFDHSKCPSISRSTVTWDVSVALSGPQFPLGKVQAEGSLLAGLLLAMLLGVAGRPTQCLSSAKWGYSVFVSENSL